MNFRNPFETTPRAFIDQAEVDPLKKEGQKDQQSEEQEQVEAGQESAEMLAYQEHAQAFIDRYSKTGFFANFAQDASISFKLSNAFYINLENGEVNLATEWFFKRGFTEEQILWAIMHEISHFRDLVMDSERLMKNFDYIKHEAKTTGEYMLNRWEQALDLSDPDQQRFFDSLKQEIPLDPKRPEKGSLNQLAMNAYKIHHAFYNCMDDIWVNNFVARKAPKFERGTKGGKAIEQLYKEQLFPGTDYTELSRHRQFIYALLRDDNVLDESSIVSPDVTEALNRQVMFNGKRYTPKELIQTFIKPRATRDTKAGERYSVIKRTLEPIFQELLQKDLEEWEPEYTPPEQQENGQSGEGQSEGESQAQPETQDSSEQEPGESSGQESPQKQPTQPGKKAAPSPTGMPFQQEVDDWDEQSIDQLPDEMMDDFVEKYKETQAQKQKKQEEAQSKEKMTPEQKAQATQRKQDDQWAEQNADSNASKEELLKNLEQFRKIESEIRPYLQELAALWQHIIYGKSREVQRGIEGHFKSGTEIDMQAVVNEFGKIQKGEFDETRIFKKITNKEVVTKKPELIRVRLVGDMSGSMDEAKLHILQQVCVLLLSSLDTFNTYLNLSRSETKTKLRVETEAYTFSDSAQKIKSFGDQKNTEKISIFKHLQNSNGYTYDNKALELISKNLSPEDQEKMRTGKIMDIVFEITDGGSSDKKASKKAVKDLLEKEFIVRAFQIGETSADDQKAFDTVWNNQELGTKYGEQVKDIAQLLSAVAKVLKDYLKEVRI